MKKTFTVFFLLMGILKIYAQPIQLQFNTKNLEGCAPLLVTFNNQSTGNISKYFWDFGNGNTSDLKNPSTIYKNEGYYDIKLVTTDVNGNKDSIVKLNYIHIFKAPKSHFYVSKLLVCTNDIVLFYDSSENGDAEIISWNWSLDSGVTSNSINPTYSYNKGNDYSIALKTTDKNGCSTTVFKPQHIRVLDAPIPDFDYKPVSLCKLPVTVDFINKTINPSGQPLNYVWHYGTLGSSIKKTPSYTFSNNGIHDITLEVSYGNICTRSKTKQKLIDLNVPLTDFKFSDSMACSPANIAFTNITDKLHNAQFLWEFGNGNFSTESNVTTAYNKPGNYNVKLTITNGNNCIQTKEKKIKINDARELSFDFNSDDSLSCRNITEALFTFKANKQIISHLWQFGESEFSSLRNPKQILHKGIYDISLTLVDVNGCKVKKTKNQYMKINPIYPFFSVPTSKGCVNLKAEFNNLCSSHFPLVSYLWKFGNGDSSTLFSPKYVYKKLGKYEPTLIVKNSIGCKDSFTFSSIYISSKPKVDFTYKRGEACADKDNISFINLTEYNDSNPYIFYWDFGFYNTHSKNRDVHPHVSYSKAGIYTIKLLAENNGCFDSIIKTDTLKIHRSKANFSVSENPCEDDSVKFYAFVPKRSKFEWYINNIYVSSKLNFSYWLPYGKHQLLLVSYDSAYDCTDEIYSSLEIRKPYQTDFTAVYDSKILCSHIPATFTDIGFKSYSSTWYIRDEVDSVFYDNPKKFVFKKSGLKTVKLISKSDLGCVSEKTKTFTASEPTTTISSNVNSICFPDSVKLINTSTSTASIHHKYWVIDKDTLRFPADTFSYYFDKYPKDANKGLNIYFYSYDENQCVSIDTAIIKISKPSAQISNYNILKLCDSTISNIEYNHNKSFPIYRNDMQWFINGKPIKDVSATLKFSSKTDTNFTVKLIVNDSDFGCADTSENINIDLKVKKMQADFFASDTVGNCPPLTVNYTNTSTAIHTTISNYNWEFKDPQNSIFKNPSKTYFYPGKYSATLTISDEDGCKSSTSKPNLITLNGPVVNFYSDVKEGCIPTTVNFKMHKENVSFFLWDLGNGIVSADENPTAIYNYAEVFNPLIIAQDSLGCTVFYYDDTTILVHQNPKANFNAEGLCKNAPFVFNNLAKDLNHPQTSYKWFFGNGDSSSETKAVYYFKSTGYKNVSLQATSEFGCKHDTTISVFVSPINVDFNISKDTVCYGDKLIFTDISTSQFKIISWNYHFGNGEFSYEKNPEYEYKNFGNYNVTLKITDDSGCFDTLTKNQIIVFDSISPNQVNMLRTTVNSESEVKFDWEKDHANSTIYYKLYRWHQGIFDSVPTVLDKSETTYIENGLQTSEKNYAYYITNKSFCHQKDIFDTAKKHETILLNTQNGENKITLNWTPYIGWENIKNYKIFRKQPLEKEYQLIAEIPGFSNNYQDKSVLCDYQYDYKIIAEEKDGNNQTSVSNIDRANSIIRSVPFAPFVIRATVNLDNETQIDWNTSHENINPVETYYLQKSLDGITFNNISEKSYQECCNPFIDNDVRTDNISYYYQLIARDICGITSEPSNIGKTILLNVNKNINDNPELAWSEYLLWEKGVKQYEIELKDPNFLFSKIKEKYKNEDLFYVDSDSKYEDYEELCYRIKAVSYDKNKGIPVISYSNEKCVTGRSHLYVPNSFTPNSDSHNPEFIVYGKFIKEFNIKIYNRWGQMIFESNNIKHSWDGKYNNQAVMDGVYVYVIHAEGYDGNQINLNGSITLLR